ncbi:MAG: outer membrane beta-barrel protein [Pirellulaceae bacterium]
MAASRAAWLVVVASLLSAAIAQSRCARAQEFGAAPMKPPGSVIWAARAEPLPTPAGPSRESLDLAPLPLDDDWRPGEAFEPGRIEAGPYEPGPLESMHGESCQCGQCVGPRFFLPGVVPRMFSWWKPVGDGRHRGIGDPLIGTSWLNRPYSVGVFTGGIFGGTLVPGNIDQRGGLLTGFRIGVDMNHYAGFETRVGFSRTDSLFLTNGGTSTVDDALLDANLLYYPLGDSHWRPFASIGLGAHRYEYYDTQYQKTVDTLMQMPIGLGVKYHLHNWMSVRFEVHDNLSFGQRDLATMNNFSVTGGVEMRFGGRRTTYFPFDPSVAPH